VNELMPRIADEDSNRLSFRIKPGDKAVILRATELVGSNITDFVVRTVLEEARKIITRNERIVLSERDSLRVLEALENPLAANDKLIEAVEALPVDP
jgi:uncharacterized protein (DUF1778 family)